MAKQVEILLVEDNPADARLTKDLLSESHIPINLNIVKDGVEAMDYLLHRGAYPNSVHPDLVLLDLNLPEKDGREVLKEIKTSAELKRLPVLILTTSGADQDINTCYELYANSYIRKPVDLNQFIDVIRVIESYWLRMAELPDGVKNHDRYRHNSGVPEQH